MSKAVAVMAILAVLCAVTVLRAGMPYLSARRSLRSHEQ